MIYNRLKVSAVTIEIIERWAKNVGINVSQRQLYRDLDLINGLLQKNEHLKVTQSEKNRKTWKIEFNESVSEKVSDEFINSFYLLRNFTPLNILSARSEDIDLIEAAFYKQNSKSKFEYNSNAHQLEIRSSKFQEEPYSAHFNDVLNKCIWAVQNQRKIKILKLVLDHSGMEERFYENEHLLLPMQILYHRGCVYMAAIEDEIDRLIILSIVQLKEFVTTNDMFDHSAYVHITQEQMDRRFGISENLDAQIYQIELEFSRAAGEYISSHFWHPTANYEIKKCGNYIMTLTCGINRELISWICQFMSLVKVINPPELKKIILEQLHNTLDLYDNHQSPFQRSLIRPKG